MAAGGTAEKTPMKIDISGPISQLLALGERDQRATLESLRTSTMKRVETDTAEHKKEQWTATGAATQPVPLSPSTRSYNGSSGIDSGSTHSSDSSGEGSGEFADSQTWTKLQASTQRKTGNTIGFHPEVLPFVPTGLDAFPMPDLLNVPPGLVHPPADVLSTHPGQTGMPQDMVPPAPFNYVVPPMVPMVPVGASDSLYAARTVFGNLMASLPPEGVPIAQDLLTMIALQHGGACNAQQTMEGIQVLRWLKAQFDGSHHGWPLQLPSIVATRSHHYKQLIATAMAGSNRAMEWQMQGMHPNGMRDNRNRKEQIRAQQTQQPISPKARQRLPQKQQNEGFSPLGKFNRSIGFQPSSYTNAHPARQHTSASLSPTGTLREHLRELQHVEIGRIFLVRKINRLGFEAVAVLKQHYSQFGVVDRVLVAHSHVKSPTHAGVVRLRPSGLGFVVMEKSKTVRTVLSLGEEQCVQGVMIRAQPFEHRHDDAEFDEVDQ